MRYWCWHTLHPDAVKFASPLRHEMEWTLRGVQLSVWPRRLYHGRRVPRAPLPNAGVTRVRAASRATWKSVTSSSSLLRAHPPDHPLPPASGPPVVHEVFAGCRQSLLGDGPSRRYLCNPCVLAWTLTPPSSLSALTQFFPKDTGLAPHVPRLADDTIPATQLQQGDPFSRRQSFASLQASTLVRPPGCADRSSCGAEPPGRLHHAAPDRLPGPGCGITSCPTWVIDTAGLSPAGLQPCRLLLHARVFDHAGSVWHSHSRARPCCLPLI